MKSAFIILLSLSTLSLHAQTFEGLIREAGEYYNQEKYQESAIAYQRAFKINEGSSNEYYNAACSWALTGDTLQSIEYLNLSADKGWKNLKHIKVDKDLRSLHEVHRWSEILAKVQENLTAYEKDFDKPLQEQLGRIYVRDQTLRQLLTDAEEKFGRDSEEMAYFWGLISEQDQLNEKEVFEILEDKGWVGKSAVGGHANMALWLVIQHAPIEIQEKYLPLLEKSVLEGESSGGHLALLVDRINMRNGKPQIYGSQITRNSETGQQEVFQIWEPQYVNQRRKEVGLGPIEDYLKRWNIEWTIKQVEK
ncbi:DUF6624 domain-containing protein [Jiulongibacter sp. NS-SX5]|uniref:DUF6624 domain-containing protein n=1 Tax=Jiulongibacter sp. NS-SX5 TaxID=3463854 RepID=UPI004059BA91